MREVRYEMVKTSTALFDNLNANMQCRKLASGLTAFGERFFKWCFLIDALQLIYYLRFKSASYSIESFVEFG